MFEGSVEREGTGNMVDTEETILVVQGVLGKFLGWAVI